MLKNIILFTLTSLNCSFSLGASKGEKLVPTKVDNSNFQILGAHGVKYLVVAPNGKRSGHLVNGKIVNEIENASYSDGDQIENLDDPNEPMSPVNYNFYSPNPALEGNYKIEMQSDTAGEYTFYIYTYDVEGGHPKPDIKRVVQLRPKKRVVFDFMFSKKSPSILADAKKSK